MKIFVITITCLAILLVVYSCCVINGDKPKWLQQLDDEEQHEYLIKQSQKKLGNHYKRY